LARTHVVLVALWRELYPRLPVRALFTDTLRKFPQTYAYADNLVEQWNIELLRYAPESVLPDCDACREWKVKAAVAAPANFDLRCLLVGVRGDEHEARKLTPTYSVNGAVTRVHPLLMWSEENVWTYIKDNALPYNPLYNEGYRSLGCKNCTQPSNAYERAGRAPDKEAQMSKLRGAGYW